MTPQLPMNPQYSLQNGQGNRAPARHHFGTPREHADWRSYTIVEVFIQGLPSEVRTVDIHRNLRKYGNIVQIFLKEKRAGDASRNAEVVFKPPPNLELWQSGLNLSFKLEDGTTSRIRFKLSGRQRKNFTINSPVRPQITYDEEIILRATSIDFGILRSERKMTILKSVSSMTQTIDDHNVDVNPQLILNLKQMQIEIRFPVYLHSARGARVREYRFFIALDDKFSIWQLQDSDGEVSYVLHVQNPPWYSRRLMQKVAQSHIEDGKSWREDDMWARQTDIVYAKEHFELIDSTPVTIRKNGNTIDVARWTTFKINVASESHTSASLRVLQDALRDFNIKIVQVNDFDVAHVTTPYEAPYWSLLPITTDKNKSDELVADTKLDISFALRYQLEVCISQGWLSEYDITKEFIEKLKGFPEYKAKQILIHVDSFEERVFNPTTIFTNIQYLKPVKARQLPANCVQIHHVTVTATGVKLHTPTIEQSNRVIRRYKASASNFLRVHFEDDNYRGQTKLYASSNNKMVLVFARVKRAMMHGISIAGRHYEFLAWGNSQLREHGCYFFSNDDKGMTAHQIRAEMGAFDNEKIVAKRAARMGQCFSTTSPIPVRIPPVSRASCIPDIFTGKYTFSDGVGKLSRLLAGLIHSNLNIAGNVPSCFQFRLGGCKGVLVVDPTLKALEVKVRASQFKFDSTSQELEIIRWSEFWQPFLNRQLILVLSDLGVSDKVFLDMQTTTIKSLDNAIMDDNAALKALRDNVDPNRMTLSICDLVTSGFRRSQEPFVMSILNLWRAWSLKYLKEKAKIPISQGCFVLGVVDETATLRGHFDSLQLPQHAPLKDKEKTLPEIFVQIMDPQTGTKKIIEGVCILARNPSLHKGDIRIVRAVNVAPLHHLCDVVVMPQTGDRDLPSMCSGGDLDGDDYIVCWDDRLIPPIWNAEPFHYDAPTPVTATGLITTEHIIDFFHHYLQNDFLGRIAHAHLATADFEEDGIDNENCLELVHLHSMAVDYPKTGVPALLPRRLERTEWPHFMEKRGRSYRAWKVLGQLYDAVKKENFKLRTAGSFDARILTALNPSPKVKAEATVLKHEYDVAMQQIMARHKIRTEFEVWSTFVLHHSKASRDFKFHEEIGQISKTLKDRFHQSILDVCGGNTFQHLSEFAVAAYQITDEEFKAATRSQDDNRAEMEPKMPFISFPWLLADTLGKIASLANLPSTAPSIPIPVSDCKALQTSTAEGSSSNSGQEQDLEKEKEPVDELVKEGEIVKGCSAVAPPQKITGTKPHELMAASKTCQNTKPKTSDPFFVLNPFAGIQMAKPKSGNVGKVVTAFRQVEAQQDDGKRSESSDDSSLVHVSQGSSSGVSHVESIDSGLGTTTEKADAETSVARQVGDEGEECNRLAVTKEEHVGSLQVQFNSMMLSDGMMKDPAEMTADEMAALGLGDDDDL